MSLRYYKRPLTTVSPRDLLLLEVLRPLSCDQALLEVGIGSGSTLLRLAGKVRDLHGVDVAAGAVERLRESFRLSTGPERRIQLFVQDMCETAASDSLPRKYDLVVSCDTLEHVPDPIAFFRNLRALVNSGGRVVLTYPNEHPSLAHGITWFDSKRALIEGLSQAGFRECKVEISAIRINRVPAAILQAAWRAPRWLGMTASQRFRNGVAAPQVFDETTFFRMSSRLERIAPAINLYSWTVMRAMIAFGPVFRQEPVTDDIWNRQVLLQIHC